MDKEVTVFVYGRTSDEMRKWRDRFEKFFGSATTTIGARGGEEKPVYLISHLYDEKRPDFAHYALSQLMYEYKREAKQDAVLAIWRDVKTRLI